MECKSCRLPITDENYVMCSVCNKAIHNECKVATSDIPICDICHINAKRKKRREIEIPDIIRRSYIETYRTCPYKFFKEVMEGHAQPPNIYTQSGIDIHDLFDQHAKSLRTIDEIKKDWSDLWHNTELYRESPDELRQKIKKRCDDSIVNFERYTMDMGKPFATEVQLITEIDKHLPKISTTVDRVDNHHGVLAITDWKTGKVAAGQKLSTDLQVPLYIYAVKTHYNLPVESFTLYYTAEDKERKYISVDDDTYVCTVKSREYFVKISDAIREVKTIFSRIKNGKFSIPSDSRSMWYQCKMCHIQESGLCQGCVEQKWQSK